MKKILKIIYNIIRGVCRLVFRLVTILIVLLLKLATYEPGKKDEITPRKARRIRALSKLKLWFFNTMPDCIVSFLGYSNYKIYINEHLKNGLQLRNE